METINIFFASNDNYAQPMGIAIHSLLDNFRSDKYKVKITILDGDISEDNKIKIKNVGKRFSTQIEFTKVSNEIFKDCKNLGRYTIVAYYRLIIPNILGEDVKKAIYLDSDILVMGNITELYEKNIDNYLIGAVQAKNTNQKYFGSGVLLMNIEEMKKRSFVENVFESIKKSNQKSNYNYTDQDIANMVCKDQWFELDYIWNFEIERSERKHTPNPMILHYITPFKPWYRFYHNYYQKYYLKYLKKWPNYRIERTDFKTAVKQILKYIPLSTNLVRLVKNQ
jgi:lipopolysaccharide biosynthesis glycosyltransferase